jgi:hypothetical protein
LHLVAKPNVETSFPPAMVALRSLSSIQRAIRPLPRTGSHAADGESLGRHLAATRPMLGMGARRPAASSCCQSPIEALPFASLGLPRQSNGTRNGAEDLAAEAMVGVSAAPTVKISGWRRKGTRAAGGLCWRLCGSRSRSPWSTSCNPGRTFAGDPINQPSVDMSCLSGTTKHLYYRKMARS